MTTDEDLTSSEAWQRGIERAKRDRAQGLLDVEQERAYIASQPGWHDGKLAACDAAIEQLRKAGEG